MGDIKLSDMKATYYPPSIQPGFMGAFPPTKNGQGSLYETGNTSYFRSYRNENLSKFQMPPYEWGLMSTPYSPRPDIAAVGGGSNLDRMLHTSKGKVTMIDRGRQQDVDDFYKACQYHRDQYNDHSGLLHPLNYFKTREYRYQCPPDPTRTYLKFPQYYTKYKSPAVLPLTLDRAYRSPPLPSRALTGRYSPSSDIAYKR